MRLMRLFSMLVLLGLVTAVKVFAQDAGDPDTCRFEPPASTWEILTEADSLFSIELWGFTDDALIKAASLGFTVTTSTGEGTGSDDSLIVVDTFIFDAGLPATVQTYSRSLLDESIDPGALDWGYNGFNVGLIDFFAAIFPVGTPTKIGDLYIKAVNPALMCNALEIAVDSSFFPPAGVFKFSPSGGEGFPPQFGSSVITVNNTLGISCDENPEIGLDQDSLFFEGYLPGPNPPTQQLNVFNTSSGELNWSAAVSPGDDWLSIDPTGGVGDGTITLEVDIAGLSVGTYYAYVEVFDPSAANSPQYAYVTLDVFGPEIGLDQDSLFFDGYLPGPNPPTQQVNIFNTAAGGELDWSASVLQGDSWLTVDPTSGIGDGFITFEVDITGLSEGSYDGWVEITDPNATNSPEFVVVILDVFAPEIDVDPSSFFFTAESGGADPPIQSLDITNIGPDGTEMNWFAANVDTWLTLSAYSGTAPSTIDLSINITGLVTGIYVDTITVTAEGASNSPVGVEVTLEITGEPPDLATSFEPDPAFVYFKFAIEPIAATVYVGNFELPYTAESVNTSTLLINGSIVPQSTSVLASYPGFVGKVLAIEILIAEFLDGYGVLYDTTSNDYTVTGLFDDGVPLDVTGSVDLIGKQSLPPFAWIVPEDDVILGGDANLSGYLDIDDIIIIIDYMFAGRKLPGPLGIADCNCSHSIDIDDVMYLIDYLYTGGPAPCGG